MEKNEIEVKRVELPQNFADLKLSTLKEIGLESRKKAADAKAALLKSGVSASIEIGDAEAVILDSISTSADRAESAFRNMGLGLGVLAHYRVWEKAKDKNGKVYGTRGKERYLKDRFPNHNVKTMLTYVKTGLNISLPVAAQNPDMDGLDKLGDLSLPVASKALPLLESENGKEELKKLLAGDKPVTGKALQDLAKAVKDRENAAETKETTEKTEKTEKTETAKREANNTTPKVDPNDFKSGAAKNKFKQCFSVFVDNGEPQITCYESSKDVRDEWLKKCLTDGSLAVEFVQLLYNAINNAQ